MFDASLGGIDKFEYPTIVDSEGLEVYSEAGVGIYKGEAQLTEQGSEGKFNVLACDSGTSTGSCWPKMIVTDARDENDKLSTEKRNLHLQKSLILKIATLREWLVHTGTQVRWTSDENVIMNDPTKDHKESRKMLRQVAGCPHRNQRIGLLHVVALCRNPRKEEHIRIHVVQRFPQEEKVLPISFFFCFWIAHILLNSRN